jgi:hypothetical protein
MTTTPAIAELDAQHQELRGMMDRCLEVADAVDKGSCEEIELQREVERLRQAFDTHHRFEDALLRPLLRNARLTGRAADRRARSDRRECSSHRAPLVPLPARDGTRCTADARPSRRDRRNARSSRRRRRGAAHQPVQSWRWRRRASRTIVDQRTVATGPSVATPVRVERRKDVVTRTRFRGRERLRVTRWNPEDTAADSRSRCHTDGCAIR